MTTAWSISIKTVGKSRFHRASPSNSTAIDEHGDDIKSSICFNNNSSNSSGPDGDDQGAVQSRPRDPLQDDGHDNHLPTNNNHSDASESNFTIVVHPDDPLYSLHEKIERVTGLKAEEQRLIYRGRIINCNSNNATAATTTNTNNIRSNNGDGRTSQRNDCNIGPLPPSSFVTGDTTSLAPELCVRDVCGLCDKQTIHLVPRISISNNKNNNNSSANSTRTASTNIATQRNATTTTTTTSSSAASNEIGVLGDGEGGSSSVASLSGEAGLSLLAALLGVPSSPSSPPSSSGGVGLPAGEGDSSARAEGEDARVNGDGSSENSGGGGGRGGGVGDTFIGMGGLGELFRGMGIPMEGVAGTGGGLFGFSPLSRDTNDDTGDRSASADNTNHRNIRIRRGARTETTTTIPPFATSTRRVRRNALPPSSTLSSSLAAARATAARLTEADIHIPDPGSVEPVRQGLLTLHTLLGNALPSLDHRQMVTMTTESFAASGVRWEEGVALLPRSFSHLPVGSPLDSHRQWYRGQWLDVLDTVNQWLEATVVEIALPSDVLPDLYPPEYSARVDNRSANNRWRMPRRPPPDAVVSANDLEGRRRLLLELVPRDDDDEEYNENEESDGDHLSQLRRRRTSQLLFSSDEGYCFRPRPENSNVQLLLIHYNGWPHRWDEWIRSDSERIRPFRTRTRHRVTPSLAAGTAYGNGSTSTFYACPTPQAVFSTSPSTAIRDEEDMISERSGMLFELSRVVQGVNELLAAATPRRSSVRSGSSNLSTESSHLPWGATLHSPGEILNHDVGGEATSLRSPSLFSHQPHLNSAQLRQLAPLVDRLGRTLTDAAPHIAALADSLPNQPVLPSSNARVGIDAPLTNDLSTTSPSHSTSAEEADISQLLAGRASRLYFGIDDNSTEENTGLDAPSRAHGQDVVHVETTSIIDPDLTDYINGMVNTSRYLGGAGSSRNSNRDSSIVDQTGSSLLASYLASMGGSAGSESADPNPFGAGAHPVGNDNPRVIRMGGGNGGNRGSGIGGSGIDIHIHAIVTGPGMGGFGGLGGFPFDNLGVGGTTPTAPPTNNHNRSFSAVATAAPSPTENNDDADLFSELYSESPDPINFHGEDNSHGERMGNDGFDGSALRQICEDCLSIDEEVSHDTNADAINSIDHVDNATAIGIIESEKTVNDDILDDNGSVSVLALSEIESQGSIASSSTSSSTSSVPTLSASFPLRLVEGIGFNIEAPAPHRSLRNRLFRRTIGRFSILSRRSREQRSSA